MHAANSDSDFDAIIYGRVMLKNPLTTDEMVLVPILGVALGHLHHVLTIFVADKQIEDAEGSLSVGDDHTEPLGKLVAMGFLLARTLPTRREMAEDKSSLPPEA